MNRVTKYCGLSCVSLVCLAILVLPRIGISSITNHQQQFREVPFYIVNTSDKPFCLQGHPDSPRVCVEPGSEAAATVQEPIVVKTAYFYTKSGLIKHWQNTQEDNHKLALVADDASEVHLNISNDGVHYEGLNQKSGMDLSEYVKWHGLKDLLI